MYCSKCGSQVAADQDVCLSCGAIVNEKKPTVQDNGGFGWGLLGFCIPIVGLILFLVWNTDRPKTAKSAGLGALISFLGWILVYVFFIVLAASFSY
ncbi:zinc ribbon domain-containing protein [Mycoplasmatota bacterium zrk1]